MKKKSKRENERYWAVIDTTGHYMPELHMSREEARKDAARQKCIRDGRFVVRKIKLTACSSPHKLPKRPL